MDELTLKINEVVESFNVLDDDQKNSELINSIKEFIEGIYDLASVDGIVLTSSNSYISVLNAIDNEDVITSMFVYLEIAKALFGEYTMKKNNIM